jgi:hypothetical protein
MSDDQVTLQLSRDDANALLGVLAALEPNEPWKAAVDRVVSDLDQQLGATEQQAD